MLQRRVYHSMAAVQRKLYVLGGNDLDYNNDRILVRHIDSYNIDTDQWTRCNFNLLTGKYLGLGNLETSIGAGEMTIVRSNSCSLGPRFDTQHPYSSSQLSVIPVPGHPKPFCGPPKGTRNTGSKSTDIHTDKTHKNKIKILNV